jgi:hypothetical protein
MRLHVANSLYIDNQYVTTSMKKLAYIAFMNS